jgi:hypothetical protein
MEIMENKIKAAIESYKKELESIESGWYIKQPSVFSRDSFVTKIVLSRTIEYLEDILNTDDPDVSFNDLADYWVKRHLGEKVNLRFDTSPGRLMEKEMDIEISSKIMSALYSGVSEELKQAIFTLGIRF